MDMMQSILLEYYKYNSWSCGDTYESIEWTDIITPQPSKDHLEYLWIRWLGYRQQLRDFPNVWTVDVPFPSKRIFKWYYIRENYHGGTVNLYQQSY